MKSLSLRIVLATTVIFLIALMGTFIALYQDAKYGFFRIQRDSLTVQADMLAARVLTKDGTPVLELGDLAEKAGKPVSYALLDPDGHVLQSYGSSGIEISADVIRRYDIDFPFRFSLSRIVDPNNGDAVVLILPDAQGTPHIVATISTRGRYLVQVSMPLLDHTLSVWDVLYSLSEASVVAVILPLLLTMVATPIVVRLALKSVRNVSRQAAEMEAATLDRRLSLDRVPSEMRELVLAFNDLLSRLDTAWRVQRDFTANAAHELRTPITALRAEVEAILPREARSATAIQFDKVARLLTQLLALAEADSRQIDAAGQFDLMALARDVVSDMAPTAIASGREISLEHRDEKPATAQGDRGVAEIALRNLVDNAVRHSLSGSGIHVTVNETQIQVTNTADHIPDEMQRTMFERFWKHDRRSSGSGLGLSIVDAIMKRLGGTVEVTSGDGTVTFTLAFRAA